MGRTRWLNEHEELAWRGYRRMTALLDARVTRDLATDTGLSAADYEVLSNLSETPGHQWRLTKLAERMLWSQSRLSHHLERMQQRGLIQRDPSDADGRGAIVTLTKQGATAIAEAAPKHLDSVRQHFIDLVTPAELDTLAAITAKVVIKLTGTDDRDHRRP
jgi:DNA-binding MarR family transcriptional regulator